MQKSKKPHILVISQCFYPETFRINDIAAEWVKRGYKVTALTGIPNYPQGKFYKGYSWFKNRRETHDGIDIMHIPLTPREKGALGLVFNYYSFLFFGLIWANTTKLKADIVFSFETSPMTQVRIGCRYAKRLGIPHFLYAQDLWPENVEAVTGIHNRAVIGYIDRMVDKIYKGTDLIFLPSPSFVEAVANRKVPVDRKKLRYWPQYAEEFYEPLPQQNVEELAGNDSFKIAFTGNIGFAQGLEVLPKAAKLLKDENVTFVMVGDGRYKEEFVKETQTLSVSDKFIMIPQQPAKRIPEILSGCDAAFISFKDVKLWEMTIPAKLQSYMACAMPILASASGETKRIVEEARCGVCTAIGDPQSLADGIKQLMGEDLTTYKNNAREYFEAHFQKKMLMDEMDNYLYKAEEYDYKI